MLKLRWQLVERMCTAQDPSAGCNLHCLGFAPDILLFSKPQLDNLGGVQPPTSHWENISKHSLSGIASHDNVRVANSWDAGSLLCKMWWKPRKKWKKRKKKICQLMCTISANPRVLDLQKGSFVFYSSYFFLFSFFNLQDKLSIGCFTPQMPITTRFEPGKAKNQKSNPGFLCQS